MGVLCHCAWFVRILCASEVQPPVVNPHCYTSAHNSAVLRHNFCGQHDNIDDKSLTQTQPNIVTFVRPQQVMGEVSAGCLLPELLAHTSSVPVRSRFLINGSPFQWYGIMGRGDMVTDVMSWIRSQPCHNSLPVRSSAASHRS